MGRPRTHSAGTSQIAEHSGGDSIPVDHANGLETTLERIRQRYALHFYLPPGVRAGQERDIEVLLADSAKRRYPDAQVRYRRTYVTPEGAVSANGPDAPEVVRESARSEPPPPDDAGSSSSGPKRRRGVSDGTSGPKINVGDATEARPANSTDAPSARSADDPSPAPGRAGSQTPPADTGDNSNRGGWRKVKPGEKP
jgi:hypothetical protein